MDNTLQQTFEKLLNTYTNDERLTVKLWHEMEQAYAAPKRKYHTLKHLEHVLAQLMEVKNKIEDWDTVLFALFYHDVVYKASRSDNEEQSAVLAAKYMKQLAVPEEKTLRCEQHILATKNHVQQSDPDTNYFTDADLSVLGQEWSLYMYLKAFQMFAVMCYPFKQITFFLPSVLYNLSSC
jgi:predicted metal-dependent HD superfamily phosphohydrolase